jgi:hypothetical protein
MKIIYREPILENTKFKKGKENNEGGFIGGKY